MGTQTQIANTIVENNADYILAVKGNQKQLLEDIKDELHFSKNISVDETVDIRHGRIETIKCSVVSCFQFIKEQKNGDKPTF